MKALLALRKIQVEHANAVAGLTWGFPAVSHFVGFCHALDRKLNDESMNSPLLGGCTIICHDHQVFTDSAYGVHTFTQKRHPATKEGKTAPFNEEGRMHLTISLLIELTLSADEYVDNNEHRFIDTPGSEEELLTNLVKRKAIALRLAGGTIIDIDQVTYTSFEGDLESRQKSARRELYRSLPGYALVDRSELLSQHHVNIRKHIPSFTLLQAWLDFGGLRYRSDSENSDDGKSIWKHIELPEKGWLVPIMIGYQALSELLPPGEVKNARDPTVPFRLVEPVHGVGQWISPHRAPNVESLMWNYSYEDPGEYCLQNNFSEHQSNARNSE